MIFDAWNGDTGIVRDANGAILWRPIRGDTHTGWVICYGPQPVVNGEVIHVRQRYLAPLSIEPLPEGWQHDVERDGVAVPLEEYPA